MSKTITLVKGDGVGPELAVQIKRLLTESGAKIDFEEVEAGEDAFKKFNDPLPKETIDSIKRNKIALKAPITTPIGSGYRSVNVQIRKLFDLYANLRPALYMEGVPTPIPNVNLIIVRENTEDLYIGQEEQPTPDKAISYKVITRSATERIARYAFKYAGDHKRKKVTVVHKANILKFTDGMFLKISKEIGAKEYPDIQCEDRIVDNMAMQLVQKPQIYDMLLCPNLYGDILSDLCAGLIGGLGIAPSANIGVDHAMFEAVHGSAPKYKGLNKVNPTAFILSSCLMLKHIGEPSIAEKIELAVKQVIKEGKRVTYDLVRGKGEPSTTSQMVDEIMNKFHSLK
ncbi:MAG: isocitrate/isopropylmalate dehydrogenase family protein [Planctomycetes bacterium]|nr:isocitrate/isopropylmalate dehydrogenase family protein [Planctomycetota bacterium]